MNKKVAIVQSNYIPWKGYFDLINSVDEFIIYDTVQYTKNDWRNRNRIKTSSGLLWLTIPVQQKGRLSLKINEIKTVDNRWRKKHWKSIVVNYAKAPYLEKYYSIFEDLYMNSKSCRLSDINFQFISGINRMLGIHTKLSCSTDYDITETDRVLKLVQLCKLSGATEYLSGPAAKDYLNESVFKKARIEIKWMDYSNYPTYNQLFPPFEHTVSIIDLILNEGPRAPKYMMSF